MPESIPCSNTSPLLDIGAVLLSVPGSDSVHVVVPYDTFTQVAFLGALYRSRILPQKKPQNLRRRPIRKIIQRGVQEIEYVLKRTRRKR